MTGFRRGGKTVSRRGWKTVSGDAECGVMMESSPSTAFEVPQAEFLFQFQIISFDDPALLSHGNQISQCDAPG